MPYCYYTCNLVPSAFLSRSGYEPKWFGAVALDAELSGRYDSPERASDDLPLCDQTCYGC